MQKNNQANLDGSFESFRKLDNRIADEFRLQSSLCNEIALLIELYEAEREGTSLTVSMLGLISGIPQTTALRYLILLEEQGHLRRVEHPMDYRKTNVRLTQSAKTALDQIFFDVQLTSSNSERMARLRQ